MMDSNNNNDNNNVLLLLAAFTQHQQLSLLELLFSINQDPSDEALETIAQRINSTSQTVANWFQARREQFQVQQVAAAAAAAAASVTNSNNHLSNLVLNNLMLDPQQLQHHQLQQQLQQHHHYQTISNASSSSPPTTTTTSTIQQPIQLGALNATRTSLDSPIDQHSIQNNFSNLHHNNHHNSSNNNNNIGSNHHHHHHHHHHDQTTQDNGQASSTLLAKLTAVTSNLAGSQQSAASIVVNSAGVGQMQQQQNHLMSGVNKLDGKMIDLLEALYAINDNPEMSAIEMISKRVDVPCHLISDWFDKKRMKLNPFAGHRSPPVNKKREGGRVVTFSEYQRSLLEAIFNENNYLHPQEYEELSKLIQVPSRNIKIWFKNRRSKQRLSSGGRTVNNIRC